MVDRHRLVEHYVSPSAAEVETERPVEAEDPAAEAAMGMARRVVTVLPTAAVAV